MNTSFYLGGVLVGAIYGAVMDYASSTNVDDSGIVSKITDDIIKLGSPMGLYYVGTLPEIDSSKFIVTPEAAAGIFTGALLQSHLSKTYGSIKNQVMDSKI